MSFLELLESKLHAVAASEIDLAISSAAKRRVKLELLSCIVAYSATSYVWIS